MLRVFKIRENRADTQIVSLLSERYTIGYYKHGCHHFDIDREGKDSFVVRQSGASVVMVSDPEKTL